MSRGTALAAMFVAAGLHAQSVYVAEVTNSAHYLPGRVFGVARGSLAVIFGDGLGPFTLQQAGYPLPAALAGTSIKISSGGQTFDARMVYASYHQVAAVIPSQAPAGMASVMVQSKYGSGGGWVNIVDRSPGIYTMTSDGIGQGAITSPQYELKSFDKPARAGETLVLWVTGLGPVAGDESNPLPGASAGEVTVYVGGQRAAVSYAVRSGCCAGLDQIAFTVPAGVAGCLVPVTVEAGGTLSNSVVLPVASGGRPCEDPVGPSASLLARTAAGQPVAGGVIFIGPASGIPIQSSRRILNVGTPTPALLRKFKRPKTAAERRAALRALRRMVDAQGESYGAYAAFSQVSGLGPAMIQAAGVIPSPGYCMVSRLPLNASAPRVSNSMLDAGPQLTLTGPMGTIPLRKSRPGQYEGRLGTYTGGLPAGSYMVASESGAPVGPFIANLPSGAALRWTNKVAALDRALPLTVTWSAAALPKYVVFGGATEYGNVGTTFLCAQAAQAGSLEVPALVVGAMPPSKSMYLFLTAHPYENPFQAQGLDVAYIANLSYDWAEVAVR